NEQQLRSWSGVLGDEMPRTMKRRAVHPVRGEAQRVELDTEHVGDATNAAEIHRSAVDVDDALQERERARVLRVDGASDDSLVRCQERFGGRLRGGVRA